MNNQNKKAPRSAIISLLVRFSEYIYAVLPSSLMARIFAGREANQTHGLFSALLSRLKFQKKVSLPIKRYIAKCFDRSVILKHLRSAAGHFPNIPIKHVGLFCFSFGLYSSVICLIERNMGISVDYRHLSFSVLTAITGSFLSLSKKSCCGAVSDSKILSPLFFGILGIKRFENNDVQGASSIKGPLSLITGILAGVIGTFTSPFTVLASIFVVLIAVLVLITPETGVILTFLILPFIKVSHLCAFSLLIFFSWFLKFARGKRLLKFDSITALSAVFALMILLGGIISVSPEEGLKEAQTKLSLMLGCFAAANLIRTPGTVKHCTKALTVSFSVLLIMGTIGNIIGFFPAQRIEIFNQIIGNNVANLFGFNTLFAYMAIVTIPIILLTADSKGNADKKTIIAVAVLITLASLVLAKARSVTLGLLLSLTVLLLLVSKRSLAYIIPSVIGIPAIVSFLPSGWVESLVHIFKLDSLSSRYAAMNAIDKIIYDSFPGGIGLGSGAFDRIYPLYSVTSYEGVLGANGLYANIQITLGFTGLIVFIALTAVIIRKYFSFLSRSQGDDPLLKNTATAVFSGVISLMAVGFVANIWSDDHVFLLFWLTVSLLSSSVKIATEQRYTLPPNGPTLELDKQTIKELSLRKDNNNE